MAGVAVGCKALPALLLPLFFVAVASAQTLPSVQAREVREEGRRPKINFRYPEIPGAAPFNEAVRQIVNPLLDTFRNTSLPGWLDGGYSAANLKNGIVSVLLKWEWYSEGAAHPQHEIASINYDSNRGQLLALSDLFRSGVDYLPTLSRLAVDALEHREDLAALTTPGGIKRGAGPVASNFKVWTLTDEYLVFAFHRVSGGRWSRGSTRSTDSAELSGAASSPIDNV